MQVMPRRAAFLALLGVVLLLQFTCALMDIAHRRMFHREMPTFLWVLCVGGALYGLQKLFQAKRNTAIFTIAGAGYVALLCFIGWILLGTLMW